MAKRWLVLLLMAFALPVIAQNYPVKTGRIIVPFPPGGATDVFARMLAQKLNDKYGQFFIVENRPGATGTIGAAFVAKSPPDGYTLILHSPSSYTAGYMYKSVPYDSEKDFAPVINAVGDRPFYLVVNASIPVKSVADLIALARRRPGEIPYSSSGVGSGAHLVMEMLNSATQTAMVHVPFKGSVPAMAAMVNGEVLVGWDNVFSASPFVKMGRLRALAVSSAKRSPVVPDVPTIQESGINGFEAYLWIGILAPAGTPAAIVERLNADWTQALQAPAMKEWMLGQLSGDFTPNTPKQFAEFLAIDTARWRKIIKGTGARLD
jgi:tripartite-type tricarboxylate transporter receptor subunit TctC